MDKRRLRQIRYEKKIRNRKNIIKLGILIAGFVLVLWLVCAGIKSLSNAIVESIPTPTPTPVAVIKSENPQNSFAKLPNPSDENNLTQFIEKQNSEKKVCYITFDDGPNNNVTPQILDILRRFNIKATFFQVGTLIEANPDMAKRVYEEGHLIANHSYDHIYSKLYSDEAAFLNEVNRCADLIKDITGENYFPLMRFPGGSHNTGTYGEAKQKLKKTLANNNIYYCDWNAISGDAESDSKTAKQLIDKVKSTSKGKNQVILLMHDSSTKIQTVEALPDIIKYFVENGYEFSTLDKILF